MSTTIRDRIITIVRGVTPTNAASVRFVCVADGRGGHVRVEDLVQRDRAFDIEHRNVRPTQHTGTATGADVVQGLDVRVGYQVPAGGNSSTAMARALEDAADLYHALCESPTNWAGDWDFARQSADAVIDSIDGGMVLRLPLEIGYAS